MLGRFDAVQKCGQRVKSAVGSMNGAVHPIWMYGIVSFQASVISTVAQFMEFGQRINLKGCSPHFGV